MEKTEKATPQKRDEARRKGQVARSMDLNGAVVLIAALLVLSMMGPFILLQVSTAARRALGLITRHEVVAVDTIWQVAAAIAGPTALAIAPIAAACAVAGVCVSVLQTGFKPSWQVIKPQGMRINPIKGAKSIFGKQSLFELLKNLLKIAVVGAIVALTLLPKLEELAALVGMPPAQLLPELGRSVLALLQRAAAAYFVIGAIDFAYQRWTHEKSIRMDKKEVEDEHKQQQLPAEVRRQQRQRQMQLGTTRMMDAVPTADVVVTNPTHYSVALRYDPAKAAPEVVAKGVDHLAMRIRSIAREHGVPVVPDPPLARSLHKTVEPGQFIPEELYAAVAQVLAFVYRMAAGGRRAA